MPKTSKKSRKSKKSSKRTMRKTPVYEPPLNQQGMDWNWPNLTTPNRKSPVHIYDEANATSCAKCAEILKRIGPQDAQYLGDDAFHNKKSKK